METYGTRKDPFGTEGYKVGPWGTSQNPRKVPSHFDSRIVGCVCEPEAERIFWFEVKAGQQAVCPCGQYFTLVKVGVYKAVGMQTKCIYSRISNPIFSNNAGFVDLRTYFPQTDAEISH